MIIKTKFAAKAATKPKSPIFDAVHETAADLHALGFIDQRKMRKMRKFDFLCQAPIPDYDSERIRALRDRFKLSMTTDSAENTKKPPE